MKVSVIITTYNRPDALRAVLDGFRVQHGLAEADWELLVADDGSGAATASMVEQFRPVFGARLQHVWHEDQGFRAGQIRNLAALHAHGDYLVFIDGDCIPQNDFLLEHLRLAEPGWAVAGNRVLMTEAFTKQYLAGNCKPVADWHLADWLRLRSSGAINNALGWLRLSLASWRKKKPETWRLFRTCNVGVWKQDFQTVDGFDHSFSGWGYEDSDLAVRLIRAGVRMKNGRFAVPMLHLWHAENDRSREAENWARFEASLKGTHVRALQGLSTLCEKP